MNFQKLLPGILAVSAAGILSLFAAGCQRIAPVTAADIASFERSFTAEGNVAPLGFALASSSCVDEGYSNLHINDGDPATKFSTVKCENYTQADKEHFIFFDLKELFEISEITLVAAKGAEANMPKEVCVFVSDDAKEYRKVGESGDITGKSKANISLTDAKGRYVKIVTKSLNFDPENGYYFELGEVEITARIYSDRNIVLNSENVWLYTEGAGTTYQLNVMKYVAKKASLKPGYLSSDESVVKVSSSGLLTAVSAGTADVYAFDGQNMATVKVKVIDDDIYDYRFGTFFHSKYTEPELLGDILDMLKEAGIELIEETQLRDKYGNRTGDYLLYLCGEKDIFYSVRDEISGKGIIDKSDEEIVNAVRKYEGKAGFGGFFILDEPAENVDKYAHAAKVVQTCNSHIIPHLNLLPMLDKKGGTYYYAEYVDSAKISGMPMRYLSYDNYPYPIGSGVAPAIYETLNRIHITGLEKDALTGYYVQCQEIANQYRKPTYTEMRYNISLGIAFGMHEFKYFPAVNPTEYANAKFLTGILGPDYSPASFYDAIKDGNKAVKEAGAVLSHAKASAVYSTTTLNPLGKVPADFYITPASKGAALVTLYESLDGGHKYIVITNSSIKDGSYTFTFGVNESVSRITEIVGDSAAPLTITAAGEIELTIDSGCFKVIEIN